MIQRVQSIWLLLASLTLLMLLILPIVTKTENGTEFCILVSGLYQKTAQGTLKMDTFLPLFISTIVIALMAFANIFTFKNRDLQKKICNVVIILTVGLSFWISQAAQKIPGGMEGAGYNAGAFMPILAIIFCFLAMRGIRKDEQLIKSADRLR
jgi:ABC-type polysaccharide transport system permease subunit